MFNEKGFDDFINNMKEEINKHDYIYGDSWKKEEIQFLEQRFKSKEYLSKSFQSVHSSIFSEQS